MTNRLKQLRKEKGLTLKELGKIASMTDANISMIENGKHSLSEQNTKFFADYFGVSTDYLLGKSDFRNTKFSDIPFALGGLESELTDKDKEMIMNLAQSLADKNRGGGNL